MIKKENQIKLSVYVLLNNNDQNDTLEHSTKYLFQIKNPRGCLCDSPHHMWKFTDLILCWVSQTHPKSSEDSLGGIEKWEKFVDIVAEKLSWCPLRRMRSLMHVQTHTSKFMCAIYCTCKIIVISLCFVIVIYFPLGEVFHWKFFIEDHIQEI